MIVDPFSVRIENPYFGAVEFYGVSFGNTKTELNTNSDVPLRRNYPKIQFQSTGVRRFEQEIESFILMESLFQNI